MTWIRAGITGGDTGSILIADPAYVVRDPDDMKYQPFESYEQMLGAVEQTMPPQSRPTAQLTNQFGAEIGVYVTNFGGDGVFPVYVDVDSRGEVHAAQIRFDGRAPR